MKYRDAKKLHNEDEVTVKQTGRVQRVVEAYHDPEHRVVMLRLEDGETYQHTLVR